MPDRLPLLDRKLPRRAAGYVLALLFAYGVTSVLVRMNALEVTGTSMLYTVSLTLLLLTICFYNKITASVTSALAVAAGAYIVWFSDIDLAPLYEEVLGFFKTIIPLFRGDEVMSPDHQLVFANLMAVFASLLAFITASRLSGSITLSISALALFVTAWYFGFTTVFYELALCAAAIAGVSAATFGRNNALRIRGAVEGDDASRGTRERGVYTTGGTAGIALYTIPVLVVAALILSQIAMPALADNFRSRTVNTFVDDIADYIGQTTPGYSRHRLSFSLSATGFGDTSNLGGPVELSSHPSMRVTTYGNSINYLRGITRTEYTGNGWLGVPADGSFRFGAAMWNDRENDVFDRIRPPADSDAGLLTSRVRYTVEAFRHAGTIFTTQRPETVTSSIRNFVPYFNRRGDMYPKELIPYASSYTVTGTQFSYLSRAVMNYIWNNEDKFPEPDEHMQEIYDAYLPAQSASAATSAHFRTAQSLARSADDPNSKFSQALAIRDWLRTNFTYTLTPSEVPDGVDFVDWFLESGEGYCVYFASAMAVMARDIGIPSRYVEGYLMLGAEGTNSVYTLTGENAHAWTELYFEGFGWIPFDATALGVAESTAPSTPSTPQVIEPSLPPSEEPSAPSDALPPSAKAPGFILPLILLAAGLAVIFGIMCGAGLWIASRYSPERLVAKHGHEGAAKIWWHETLRLLPKFEPRAVRQPGETGTAFAARLGSVVPNPVCSFKAFTDTVLRAYYSQSGISDSDADAVFRYYDYLRGKLMRHLTPAGYLIWYIRRKRDS